jgi:hypothetical protein
MYYSLRRQVGCTCTVSIGCHAAVVSLVFLVLLQGGYNKLNDQSCKRVLHAVCHNRALRKVGGGSRTQAVVMCGGAEAFC